MQSVLLILLLLVALALTIVVLMQRSEGGGLGIGGGGGGAMTGRSAANAMTKLTWILAAAFFSLSIALTIISSNNANSGSVVDRIAAPTGGGDVQTPSLLGDDLLPPAPDDAPAAPPKAE